MSEQELRAVVLSIERSSLHDGPGIRTTVFLKGCPLHCLWCHNPESQDFDPVLSFNAEKCALCGACVAACPAEALEIKGSRMSLDEVIGTVLLDRDYYTVSGGGLTVSGGEPMARFAFTLALLKAAGKAGIHRCLETCGHAPRDRYREIARETDLFLMDWKESDPVRHREYTGVDNGLIEANLRFLDSLGASIILRCPVVPSLNDRPDHFAKIAALAEELSAVRAVEVMPYHPLGASKSRRIGREYPLPDIDFVSAEQADLWRREIARGTDKVVFDPV